MRATSMRRLIGGAAALMLVGTTLLTAAGVALAADTRKIYIGPDPAFTDGNATLVFTPVTAGGDSLSTIYVKNIDNQTLTHVVITIAKSQDGSTISDQVLGPNASKCDSSIDPITCDFGNLKANATRQFSIIIRAGTGTTSFVTAKVVFNESNNPNGGNQQIESADGTLPIGAATCHSLATFLPPGIGKTLIPDDGTTCSGEGQRSGLIVPSNANGNIVSVNDATTASGCPTGFSCLGNQVLGTVNNGSTVSPFLKWSIFYSNAVLGTVNPGKVAFVHEGTTILAGNKGLCKTPNSSNCHEPYQVQAGGVLFIIRTDTNGLIKGMH
ncbi:MAG TPA: hypothetical protein VHM48_00010 [Candidatus Limnocylindrales bacterium]|nr:hypothetical protein [Candidatus Limnocylindrales bacterium]